MDRPVDLDTAREAFVEAITREDRYAPVLLREDAAALSKAVCKTCNVCTNANIQVCFETLSHILP